MDIKTGMTILGELIFTGALIYLFYKEDRVLSLENRVIKKITDAFSKKKHTREIKRQQKINKKAMYIPLKEKSMNTKSKAA